MSKQHKSQYVPGLGIVNIPGPIDKSFSVADRKTNAELANPAGTTEWTNNGVSVIPKHEVAYSHKHDELDKNDPEYADELGDEGISGTGTEELATGDVEYQDELGDEGTPGTGVDELAEGDADLGSGTDGEDNVEEYDWEDDDVGDGSGDDNYKSQVVDKSIVLKSGMQVSAPDYGIAGEVFSVGDDGTVTVKSRGRLVTFAQDEIAIVK